MKTNLLFLIIPIIFLFACSEDDAAQPSTSAKPISKDIFGLKSLPTIDQESDIVIYGSSMHGINSSFSIYADFKDTLSNYVPVGNLTVNGLSPVYQSSNSSYEFSSALNSSNLSFFGDTITVNVSGSPFGNYVNKIYNPELIKITGIIQNGINILDSASHVVKQLGDITINWNSDPNFNDDLLFILIPRPYCFNGNQRCNLENLPVIQEIIINDGNYTIPESILENYENIGTSPNTDGFDIMLGTANQNIIVHSIDVETVITVFSYDSYGLKIIE